jgi:hypothetical protein
LRTAITAANCCFHRVRFEAAIFFYSPFTGEVRFSLRAQGGDRVVNETVLALDEKAGESTALQGAVTFPAPGGRT